MSDRNRAFIRPTTHLYASDYVNNLRAKVKFSGTSNLARNVAAQGGLMPLRMPGGRLKPYQGTYGFSATTVTPNSTKTYCLNTSRSYLDLLDITKGKYLLTPPNPTMQNITLDDIEPSELYNGVYFENKYEGNSNMIYSTSAFGTDYNEIIYNPLSSANQEIFVDPSYNMFYESQSCLTNNAYFRNIQIRDDLGVEGKAHLDRNLNSCLLNGFTYPSKFSLEYNSEDCINVNNDLQTLMESAPAFIPVLLSTIATEDDTTNTFNLNPDVNILSNRTLTIFAGQTLNIGSRVTLNNNGTVIINAGGIININGNITNNAGGIINNNSGGTINNNTGGTITNNPGGIITNNGTINKATTTLGNFTIPEQTYSSGGTTFTLTPPSSNNTTGAFSYKSSNTSIASISGYTINISNAGTVTITATQEETINYYASSTTASLLINKATTVLGNFNIPEQTYSSGGTTFTLTPPSSNNTTGAFSYESSNTSIASISGYTVNILQAGTVTITVTQEETTNYYASSKPVTASLIINKAITNLGNFTIPSQTYSSGGTTFTLTPPSSNNTTGAFSYESSNTSIASISGSTVNILNSGTVTITATQEETTNYYASSKPVTASLLINKATTNLRNFNIPEQTYSPGGTSFTLTPPSSNNTTGAFSYESSNPSIASILSVVTATGTFTETQIYSISISSSGQYQTAVGWQRYINVSSDFGVNWTQKGEVESYTVVSVSSTGQYQSATVSAGQIWISSDFGMNWVAKASSLDWNGVSISSTGQYQSATVYGGQIWISSDFGMNWAAKASSMNWYDVSISSTGQYQSATVFQGQIWISSDFGMNWVAKASSLDWNGVSISSSGQYQTATVFQGQIWISSDFGMNWAAKASYLNWNSVSISSTGQYQTAIINNGQIWISSDFGMNWAAKASYLNWNSVSISSTGQYQTAYDYNNYMYFSRDYGFTWSTTASYEGSGSIVHILQAGTVTITATQEETTNYYASSTTASLLINKATTNLRNFNIPEQTYSPGGTFTLTPPSSNNTTGAFSYESSDTSIASISGSTVHILQAGTVTITVTQEETTDYSASSTTASLIINKATTTLGNFTVPAQTYSPGGTFTLTPPPSNNTTGAFSYESSDTSIASISGSTVHILQAGTVTITATQEETTNYYASSKPVTASLLINKATTTLDSFIIPEQTYIRDIFTYQLPTPISSRTGQFIYSSQNTDIVTVSQSGLLTIVRGGTTTITVMQEATDNYLAGTTAANIYVASLWF